MLTQDRRKYLDGKVATWQSMHGYTTHEMERMFNEVNAIPSDGRLCTMKVMRQYLTARQNEYVPLHPVAEIIG